jgi:hypothetical protein
MVNGGYFYILTTILCEAGILIITKNEKEDEIDRR